MKNLKTMKIEKEHMQYYASEIVDKSVSKGDIFKVVRKVQSEAKENGIYLSNCADLYWFLIECREKIPDK